MRLRSVYLENFRAYKEPARIELEDFTAFIGKNDVGKSTILEALEIFFNNQTVKLDKDDLSVGAEDKTIIIGCEFSDYPNELVLDASAATNLSDEYLLNSNGRLELKKKFDVSGTKIKESIFAVAQHPDNEKLNDLLTLKNAQLKSRMSELAVPQDNVRLSSNPSIRMAIWKSQELILKEQWISLNEEDGKKIWSRLEENLPIFALFQADRPSRDEDSEVQDPMKLAVTEAVKSVEEELAKIRTVVEKKVIEVAERTLNKLREIDSELASQLKPSFKSEPKWDAFKLSLTGEDDIPINKRGSGVRRLILLSFFRAEAERKREQKDAPSIIYAIEEPEASQHPHNQRIIAEALLELAELSGCQVLITTHVPALANLIPVRSLRHVCRNSDDKNIIESGEDNKVARAIASSLGSLPDHRIKVIVYVEGPNDVAFIRAVSQVYSDNDSTLVNLKTDPRTVVLPISGSNLKQWVMEDYLKNLNCPQVHIYDRGTSNPPKYQREHDEINSRDSQKCFLTKRNEAENYIHHEAISRCFKIQIPAFQADDDVPLIVARAVHEVDSSPDKKDWDTMLNNDEGRKKIEKKMSVAKKHLNLQAVSAMSYEELKEIDSEGEIRNWLLFISQLVN